MGVEDLGAHNTLAPAAAVTRMFTIKPCRWNNGMRLMHSDLVGKLLLRLGVGVVLGVGARAIATTRAMPTTCLPMTIRSMPDCPEVWGAIIRSSLVRG